jgi:hypothetical protein
VCFFNGWLVTIACSVKLVTAKIFCSDCELESISVSVLLQMLWPCLVVLSDLPILEDPFDASDRLCKRFLIIPLLGRACAPATFCGQ